MVADEPGDGARISNGSLVLSGSILEFSHHMKGCSNPRGT